MWILEFIDNMFGGNRKHPSDNYGHDLYVEGYKPEPELEICPYCGSDLEDDGTCRASHELDIDELTKKLDEMSDRDFHEAINEIKEMSKEKCHPDTCNGECQGMGWCDVAKDFRKTL